MPSGAGLGGGVVFGTVLATEAFGSDIAMSPCPQAEDAIIAQRNDAARNSIFIFLRSSRRFAARCLGETRSERGRPTG